MMRTKPRGLVALIATLALLGVPASATAAGQLQRPQETASLGTFAGVRYVQYEGFFVGRTSTGSYRVPYRLSAPADPALSNRTAVVEVPHFAAGTTLRDDSLGRPFLFERRFIHASVGWSTATFGDGETVTNRILDPEAEGGLHPWRACASRRGRAY